MSNTVMLVVVMGQTPPPEHYSISRFWPHGRKIIVSPLRSAPLPPFTASTPPLRSVVVPTRYASCGWWARQRESDSWGVAIHLRLKILSSTLSLPPRGWRRGEEGVRRDSQEQLHHRPPRGSGTFTTRANLASTRASSTLTIVLRSTPTTAAHRRLGTRILPWH